MLFVVNAGYSICGGDLLRWECFLRDKRCICVLDGIHGLNGLGCIEVTVKEGKSGECEGSGVFSHWVRFKGEWISWSGDLRFMESDRLCIHYKKK